MESYLELVSVPAIAAVVYWIIAIIKYAVKEKKLGNSDASCPAFSLIKFYRCRSRMSDNVR